MDVIQMFNKSRQIHQWEERLEGPDLPIWMDGGYQKNEDY